MKFSFPNHIKATEDGGERAAEANCEQRQGDENGGTGGGENECTGRQGSGATKFPKRRAPSREKRRRPDADRKGFMW